MSDQERRIGVMTDVHANLPALESVLADLSRLGCDDIVHVGDAIGIGPFPVETLMRLLEIPHLRFLMGNHDAWFGDGLPLLRPDWMSPGEVAHQRWVHAALDRADPTLKTVVASWPWQIDEVIANTRIRWQHYALDATGDATERGFASIVQQPTGDDLDRIFEMLRSDSKRPDLIVCGHHHPPMDIIGSSGVRYYNPGALGCSHDALARFAILEISDDGGYQVSSHAVSYDVDLVIDALETREVPERAFIRTIFFGR
jgi:predicted phosphodiesterase